MSSPSPPAESSLPAHPLNPEMVYRPVTPGSTDGLLSDPDDDLPPPSYKIRISVLTLLRIAVLVIGFVAWVFWAKMLDGGDEVMTIIFIELLFLVLWTLANLPLKQAKWAWKHVCPAGRMLKVGLTCQIGPLRCVLGSARDGDDDAPRGGKEKVRLGWVVDLGFAVTLLVFSVVKQTWTWQHVRWYYVDSFVLLYLVVGFESVIVIWTLILVFTKTKKSVAIIISADDVEAGSEYRIRLPQEEDVRLLRGGKGHVSVAA